MLRVRLKDKNYIKLNKYYFVSRKKKYYNRNKNKSRNNRKNKLNYFIIFSVFFSTIIILINIIKYKNKKSEISQIKNKNKFSSNFIENQEYFNNLLKELNTNETYKEEKICYYKDYDTCHYKYLCPKKVVGKNLKLFGYLRDGSYVLTDDLKDITIAYSFGIDGDIAFDMKIADEGIDVYMYDPYIFKLSFPNFNTGSNNDFKNDINYIKNKLHFFKIGLTGSKHHLSNMKTLEEILRLNGHMNKKNMILKIDIEGAELEALKEVPEEILKKFKYITLELHIPEKPEDYLIDIFKKLSKYHQIIYIRCNNINGKIIKFGYNKIWKYIEATYIIKEGNEFERDNSIYPLKEFYFINNARLPDANYNLNIYKLFYQK